MYGWNEGRKGLKLRSRRFLLRVWESFERLDEFDQFLIIVFWMTLILGLCWGFGLIICRLS